MKRITVICACLLLLVLSGCGQADGRSSISLAGLDDPAGSDVIATLNGKPVTFDELRHEARGDLVRLKFERYETLRRQLDQLVEKRLLEDEAKSRGITVDELMIAEVNEKIVPPTEGEIYEYYEKNRRKSAGQPLEAVRHLIVKDMNRILEVNRRVQFVEELREKAGYELRFEPPRVKLTPPDGAPARGPEDAPITMIEFSDFQCPYCRRAHPTVERLLTAYNDKIRFIYVDYPLDMHPRAKPASTAAFCAGEQDAYWEFHTDLMAIAGDLSDGDFTQRAMKLGLDVEAFSACYHSDRYKDLIEASLETGQELGVRATPSFLINGVLLRGAKPYGHFEKAIEEELARIEAGG